MGGSYSGNMSDRIKMTAKANIGVVKRTAGLPIVSRTQTVSIPKPIAKFTNSSPKIVPKPKIHISQSSTPMSVDEDTNQLKRKREDDDYDTNL